MKHLTAIITLCLLVLACSVPTDDTAQVFDQNELPETLRASTTTTTPVPEGAIRLVEYYLLSQPLDQEQRKVARAPREIPQTDLLTELLRPLFSEDFAAESTDLFNQVTVFELIEVDRLEEESPVAIVRLGFDGENPPNDEILRDAAAQLVYTLTALETVDSILIEIDDQPQPLPTSNEGNKDTPVTRADYERYDPLFVPEAATTTEPGEN